MSDQPPADWYTDPEDESLYRYWDGSIWTEHRAPRHADADDESGSAPGGLRGPGELIGDSFSLMRRQWRGCAAAALVTISTQVVLGVLMLFAANEILMGELGEIWERFTAPDFDPTTPENEEYLASLEYDLSLANFAPVVVALLVVWFASNVAKATVTRLTLADLRGRAPSVSVVVRQALRRVPRLMGVDLQLLVLAIAAVTIVVLAGVAAPVLLILVLPALVAAIMLSTAIISLAYVVASAGPVGGSLRYAVRLVRTRFWAVLGRMLLIILIILAMSLGISLLAGLATASLGSLSLLTQVINTLVGAVLGILAIAASAIIYDDLGGESD